MEEGKGSGSFHSFHSRKRASKLKSVPLEAKRVKLEQEKPSIRRSKRLQEKASLSAPTGISAGELKSEWQLPSPVVLVSKLHKAKVLTHTDEKVLSTKLKPKQAATPPAVSSDSVANCSTDSQPKAHRHYSLRARKCGLSSVTQLSMAESIRDGEGTIKEGSIQDQALPQSDEHDPIEPQDSDIVTHFAASFSRLHSQFHRSASSTKAHSLLQILSETSEAEVQLHCVTELGQILVMGNEEILMGFPLNQTVQALVMCLQSEHIFDVSLMACRALTYMMEALPQSVVIMSDAIPALIDKLKSIECLDVAEQALVALEILSRKHSKRILELDGVRAALLYFDFFPMNSQRQAICIAANCARSVSVANFSVFAEALPVLSSRLQHQDVKSVEWCCLAFSKLISSLSNQSNLLEEVCAHGLLPNLQQLLVVSPPVLTGSTFVMVLQIMSKLCYFCPATSVKLIKLNIGETLQYLFAEREESKDDFALWNPSRSYSETLEFFNLSSELLPPLPNANPVDAESSSRKVTVWQWQDDSQFWRDYDEDAQLVIEAAYGASETSVSLTINGVSYIIDFVAKNQINMHTGNLRCVQKSEREGQSSLQGSSSDARTIFWKEDPQFFDQYIMTTFPLVYAFHETTDYPALQLKSMQCLLRFLYFARNDVVAHLLKDVCISSHLVEMLSSTNLRTVACTIQIADTLMQKLPEIFHTYFRREGVMHKLQGIVESCSKVQLKEVKQSPIASTSAVEPSVPGSPSGFGRFTQVLRRSSSRLKRMLSKYDSSEAGPPQESSGVQAQPSKVTKSVQSIQSQGEQKMDQVTQWIHKQGKKLLLEWEFVGKTDQHPAFTTLLQLSTVVEGLSTENLKSSEESLMHLKDLLLNVEQCPTAFEMLHSGLLERLLNFVVEDCNPYSELWTTRIQLLLRVMCGLPEGDNAKSFRNFLKLTQVCLGQMERLPVLSYEFSQARERSSLSFLSSRPVKCKLERHPEDTVLKKLKGGPIRIDPLATVQAVERYLVAKGVCQSSKRHARSSADNEDITVAQRLLAENGQDTVHALELVIGSFVLPYNLTVMEALLIYRGSPLELAKGSCDASTVVTPYSLWAGTHTIYYRSVRADEVNTDISSEGSRHSFSRQSSESKLKSPHTKHKWSVETGSDTNPSEEAVHNRGLLWLCQELIEDISVPTGPQKQLVVFHLLKVLHLLAHHWPHFWSTSRFKCGKIVASDLQFINSKVTSKANRQLQDTMSIATGRLPQWLIAIPRACPFLFPFETRHKLFFVTAFDKDRAIIKLQEQHMDISGANAADGVTPQLEKCKFCVSRNNTLDQAKQIMSDVGGGKCAIEIQFQDEVGIGLGPTLEFYTLVSAELQHMELNIWRGEMLETLGPLTGSNMQYVFSSTGLFPSPLGESAQPGEVQQKCELFRFLGIFLARAIMDFRMVDLPLSEAFCKLVLDQSDSFTVDDLKEVDPVFAQSYLHLMQLSSSAVDVDADIAALDLDFTIPGCPEAEMKPGGKDIQVTSQNIREYLQLVFDWVLARGVKSQVQAFQEGFNSVFPLKHLQVFQPHELCKVFCGSSYLPWPVKELHEQCKPDHGYSHDSKVIHFLFTILSNFNKNEQRQFLQFVTGSPHLPIGGFRSLHPPLTIVRKTLEQDQKADAYLPSVMTCMNYLKLPEYSSLDVMRERLLTAMDEGQLSFHLS